jgi:triosephosphate isomerase (TIM)
MRRKLVAGNWKMNGSQAFVDSLLKDILSGLNDFSTADVAVFPPFVYLSQVRQLLADAAIGFGAQNLSEHESGAFTGEVSALMLKDIGCNYVIIGHSERRHVFGESSELVAAKFVAAQTQGLIPVLCVGETQQEREQNLTEKVILEQLQPVIAKVGVEGLHQAIVAYEPVWAIGTGLTATPEQAQETHAFIRRHIAQKDAVVADGLQILYGGSVKADNAAAIFAMADVDGGLIGGAALKAQDFVEICRSC